MNIGLKWVKFELILPVVFYINRSRIMKICRSISGAVFNELSGWFKKLKELNQVTEFPLHVNFSKKSIPD